MRFGPVSVVPPVQPGPGVVVGQAVEVGEEVDLLLPPAVGGATRIGDAHGGLLILLHHRLVSAVGMFLRVASPWVRVVTLSVGMDFLAMGFTVLVCDRAGQP
jgi:hypothetical protein